MRPVCCFLFTLVLANVQARGQSAQSFQKSPNHYGFIENKGQLADQHGNPQPDVRYLLPARGMNVQLRANGFSYDVYRWHHDGPPAEGAVYGPFPEGEQPCYFHRIDVAFEGASPDVQLLPTERSADYLNYYLAHLPEDGATYVHHYRRVLYKGLYPGIDVEFYVPADGSKPVEYNIIVHPGGDPGRVKLRYEGAPVALEQAHNRLKFDTRFGTMYEWVPASWYEVGDKRQHVEVQYTAIDENTFGFSVPERPAMPGARLVIDPVPVVVWATYYGGTGTEDIRGIASDDSSNAYIVGWTQSIGMVSTSGAHQIVYAGSRDGFIARFDTTGALNWATYYGGNLTDEFFDIKYDGNNYLYACGTTRSTNNIATAGTFQPGKLSSSIRYDGFLVKFSTSGTRVWGTYCGGSVNDVARSIGIDAWQNIYVTGTTSSTSGFSTPGAYQVAYGGGASDAFLAKFDDTGQRLWGTYFGGPDADLAYHLAIDNFGNVYIAGETESDTLISTPGTHQPVYGGGTLDGFVAKFDSSGARLWSTYIGGNSPEFVRTIVPFGADHILIGGRTQSDNAIATQGAYQSQRSQSQYDAGFIMKLSKDGTRLWGTYIDGTGGQEISVLYPLNDDEYYVAGGSSGIIQTSPFALYHGVSGFERRVVISKWKDNMPLYISMYPGTFTYTLITPTNVALSIVPSGKVYLASSSGVTGYATSGTHQTTHQGLGDVLLSLLDDRCFVIPSSNSPVCAGDTLFLYAGGGTSYQWSGPHGFQASTAEAFIVNPQITVSGTYTVTVSEPVGGCSYFATTEVVVLPNPPFNTTGNSPVCAGGTLHISPVGGASWQWAGPGGYTSTDKDLIIPNISPTQAGTYSLTITHANGCQRSGTVTVALHPPMPLAAGSNSPVCEGKALQLTASGAATYQWTGPGGFGTNQANPVINNVQLSAAGTYRLVATDSAGCMDTAYVQVIVEVCTGIDPGGVPGLAVRPNPTSGLLMVSATAPLALLELYDIAGRLVLRQCPTATAAELDMSALPTGTYLLHVHTHSGRAVRTVVKE